MSNSVFWRLVWKEYRMQRAFWISMAVIVLLGQLAAVVFADPGQERLQWLFGLALALPAFYAVGCGATLFATEHEVGTYEFQRALPVSASRLFFSKVAFAGMSTPLLIVLLWLVAVILAGWQFPRASYHANSWVMWGLGAVEMFLWGTLFSLVCAQPLKAAVLGITAGTISIHWAASLTTTRYFPFELEAYLDVVGVRLGVVAVLAAADVWLGLRWLRDKTTRQHAGRGFLSSEASDAEGKCAGDLAVPSGTAVLGRLVWQQWRQSARMVAALSALVAPAVVMGVGWWVWAVAVGYSHRHAWEDPGTTILAFLALSAAPLAGACVFLADRRGRGFRFLVERGVRPTAVWLSRQAVWLMAVLFWIAVAGPALLLPAAWESGGQEQLHVAIGLAGFVLLAFSAGQLCSMLFRSGILAGFFSILLTGLLCVWAALMWFLDVPWAWSVVPIPAVLLLATWLRTSGWMLEQNRLRKWIAPALVLAVSGAALLVGVPLYRVYSVPLVDPGFSLDEFTRPRTAQQAATLGLYRRAADLYKHSNAAQQVSGDPSEELTAEETAWLEDNREAIAIGLEASQQEHCDFFDPSRKLHVWRVQRVGELVARSGVVFQCQGDLDAALERYLAAVRISRHMRQRCDYPNFADALEREVHKRLPYWAAHPDQTSERIKAAIERLDKVLEGLPSRSSAIKGQYVLLRQVIAGDPEGLSAVGLEGRVAWEITLWARCLPWERVRALRVLDLLTRQDLNILHEAESTASKGDRMPYWRGYPPRYWLEWTESIPVLDRFYDPQGREQACRFAEMETRRRATRLILAIEAWKTEHGKLPESLEALVGPYLDPMPMDPFTGQPFRYFPEGLAIEARAAWQPEGALAIKAGQPAVWSAGPSVLYKGAGESVLGEYEIYIGDTYSMRPTFECQVWQSGWLFPIP